MSTDDTPEPQPGLTESEADRLTYEAMRRDGRFVPQSPGEVARAESAPGEPPAELPPGLRDPLAILAVAAPTDAESSPCPAAPAESVPVESSTACPSPPPASTEPGKPTRRPRRALAWVAASVFAALIGYQGFVWWSHSHAVHTAEVALRAGEDEFARIEAERQAVQAGPLAELKGAAAEEAEVIRLYQEAREKARKAAEEKAFVVRVTGPERIQPGAPNAWQIETLRGGAVARPKRLDVVVKDARDRELFRQTHDKPVGAAKLELPPAFWTKVEPGAELFLEVVAHPGDDGKAVLAERLPLERPVYVTHLVTDKPLYKPGEVVRFRSLTLDRATLTPPEAELHLAFKLRNPADAVTPLESGTARLVRDLKPVLGPDGKPLRGIGVGEYVIPAESPGGEYKLDLFEVDTAGKEVLLETRKFLVNRYVPDTFEKKLEFDGKSYGPGDTVQARVEVSRTAGGPMKDARADVVATANGVAFHTQKDARFTTITDAAGVKTVLDVRFKLPAKISEDPGAVPGAFLSVNIRDGSDAEAIGRPIPLVTKTLNVEFFPEGGDMVAGVPGRVYFLVRTPAGTRGLSPAEPGFTAAPGGKPADLKGVITDGTNTVAEVATLTDAENPGVNRGHGVFTLTPKARTKYFLKITSPAGINPPTPEGFPLPAVKAHGVALTALDAVTPRGGAVRVRLQSPTGPKTLHVGAYVRERLVAQQKVTLEANTPADVSLTRPDSAGGVTRVTVFEELMGDAPGRTVLVPRAERLVFRAPGQQLVLHANPDKLRYSPSDTVRLDLAALTEAGQPAPAVLMVAVVNRSVITMADNKHDRLQSTHFLLSGEVRNSAELEHADFLLTDHPKAAVALDLLLGTQGWRRFAEQGRPPENPVDRSDVEKLRAAHGQHPATVQFTQLEEQRLQAEFAPKLEAARLRWAAAETAWNNIPSPLVEERNAAVAQIYAAESRVREAQDGLLQFKERFARIREAAGPALVMAVVLLGVFAFFMAVISGTSTKPAGRGRPLVAAVATVIVCGLAVLTIINLGTNANSTFSFVGSSISPQSASERLSAEASAEVKDARAALAWAERGRIPPVQITHLSGISESGYVIYFDPTTGRRNNLEARLRELLEYDLLTERKAGFTPDGARLQVDRERLTSALRPHLTWPNVAFEYDGRARFRRINPSRPAQDSIIMGGESLPASVTPFVVREYAHQRDPALGEVRADFTETVYWHPALVLPKDGKATVEFQLSDDIARYQVLVAGHTPDGRVGAMTTTIEARKPFSVDPKLPLEISHTDTVVAPVRVTNDSDAPRKVGIAAAAKNLGGADGFREVIELAANAKSRKLLRLNANTLEGDATLLVEGASGAEKDTIARTIRVVPDGFPGVGSVSDVLEAGRARGSVTLPKDLVKGSLKVRLEMYPTSMADLVKGLDGLLREPSGCFEQTSTNNYPNTLILDYLNQTNQANPEAAKRAKELLDRGYARLTSFECPETPTRSRRGYEWFGAADRPHLALTAYGLLQFKDMARVHPVDPEMLKRTQSFLLSRKDGNGGFTQPADGHSFGMAPKHIVDAYVVWALVESDPDDAGKLDLRAEIAALRTAALDATSAGGKDPYFVALVANVMLLRNDREAAHKLLDRLKEKHVKGGAVTGAQTSITRSGGRDLGIEATALALLGWLRANDPTYATTIKDATRWITRQRGGFGGFGSTQSTILALKALTLYAKKNAHPAEAGELKLSVGGKVVASRAFTEKDVDVIGVDLANPEAVFKAGDKVEVEVTTTARQPYPFALSYSYTTLTPLSAERCAVRVGTRLGKAEAVEGEGVPLHITLENTVKRDHGMAVAVIGIPAGMKVPTDMKQLTDLRERGQIAYFETRGRELILYWRSLTPEQKIALTVDLVCDVPGSYRGPASRAYLYYDADHKHWVEPLSVTIAPAPGGE